MKISVWSDYACPFCWIGEVRLRKALAELGMLEATELMPRAFELNPHAPATTRENGLATIAGRYGMSLTQARAEFARIAALAEADGITLHQENTWHTNTFNAHRLMKLGLATGDRKLAETLNELLFAAFFVENLNLADAEVLLRTGRQAGLAEADIRRLLTSEEFAAEVRRDEAEASRRGIHAVPYFLLENGASASGALSVEEFRTILTSAAGSAHGAQCGPEGCRLA